MNFISIEEYDLMCRENADADLPQYPSAAWAQVVHDYTMFFAVACAPDKTGETRMAKYLQSRKFALAGGVFDINQQQTGIYLRSMTDRSHCEERNCSPFFFCPWFAPHPVLVLVEGYLDMMSVARVHPCVVAMGGVALTKEQSYWLAMMHRCDIFSMVLMIRDVEPSGTGGKGAAHTRDLLADVSVPVVVFPTPIGAKDPGELYRSAAWEQWLDSMADRIIK